MLVDILCLRAGVFGKAKRNCQNERLHADALTAFGGDKVWRQSNQSKRFTLMS